MRILATGFNAHKQIYQQEHDCHGFTEVVAVNKKEDDHDTQHLRLATWSTLSWSTSSKIITRGFQELAWPVQSDQTLHSIVGDHNGMLGLLLNERLWCAQKSDNESREYSLLDVGYSYSPRLLHMAVADNGRTVVIHEERPPELQPKTAYSLQVVRNIVISEFRTFAAMRGWCEDPEGLNMQPIIQHTFIQPVQRLVAGAASFCLLTKSGEVYTWGDGRRNALGRSRKHDGSSNSHLPSLVTALQGIKIEKICHGGGMFGAVSVDGAAYLWGLSMPPESRLVSTLASMPADEDVALITLNANGDDEPDIVDMDIGNGHAAVVTKAGHLYVVGSDSNGQLGLMRYHSLEDEDQSESFVVDWTRVTLHETVRAVICGPKSTAILV